MATIVPSLLTLLFLYAHAAVQLASGFWKTEDGAYAPFLLLLAGYLAFRVWRQERATLVRPVALGIVSFCMGLAVLLAGRMLGNISIEFGSILLVAPSLILALGGWRSLLRYGYPLGTLAVAVPLPGSLVVALTFPLKLAASACAAGALALMGLPIDRQGVTIDIGSYRLMVVDACSGLQSMYSLVASVFLYLSLVGHRSPGRTALLLASILPIAFLANVVRVVVLALITFWFGDAAGEGFLHGFAGITMFLVALLAIIALDARPRAARR